jgi:AcrR family transcriptional regulator
MEKEDRRVRRTKKSLGDALIALALEYEYEEISIQEITTRADIGYRTFFRHYADKDALLKDVLGATMQDLRDLMVPPQPELLSTPDYKEIEVKNAVVLFKHVQEHSDLYCVLLRSDRNILESVKVFATQAIETNIGALIEPEIPIEIIANHIASSTLALVGWWLDKQMRYSPEVMGEYLVRLIAQPTRELFLQAATRKTGLIE